MLKILGIFLIIFIIMGLTQGNKIIGVQDINIELYFGLLSYALAFFFGIVFQNKMKEIHMFPPKNIFYRNIIYGVYTIIFFILPTLLEKF